MSLTIEELSELEDKILTEIPDKITAALTKLNRSGGLEEFLTILGMVDLLDKQQEFYSYKEGKIVVIGGTEVKEEVLLSIAKKLGIDKSRFEFCLDYKQIQKYDFRKMQYAPQYRIILFGPQPHSGHGKGDSGSILAEVENSPAYPRVERLISGNELKITKSNFRDMLKRLLDEDYIQHLGITNCECYRSMVKYYNSCTIILSFQKWKLCKWMMQ